MDYENMSDQEILALDMFKVFGFTEQSLKGQEILQRMEEIIQNRYFDRVLASLTAQEKQQFDDLPEDDADAFNAFLAKACPKHQEYMIEETIRFKREQIREFLKIQAQVDAAMQAAQKKA